MTTEIDNILHKAAKTFANKLSRTFSFKIENAGFITLNNNDISIAITAYQDDQKQICVAYEIKQGDNSCGSGIFNFEIENYKIRTVNKKITDLLEVVEKLS